jgi:hypothetical protein
MAETYNNHDISDLLDKINSLNSKISHLKEINEQKTERSPATKMFTLDFIDSENLEEIEEGIRETVKGVVLSKAAVCEALAHIDKKKLYSQAGYTNFRQYLQDERIPIKYKTAKEYAKIGDTLMRHRGSLDEVDFSEEDGLKKLIYLDKALKNHTGETLTVYKKVKEYSLREFQKFAAAAQRKPAGSAGEASSVSDYGIYFEAEGRSVYRCTRAGGRTTVLKITDPEFPDGPIDREYLEYLEELKKAAEKYFLKKSRNDY